MKIKEIIRESNFDDEFDNDLNGVDDTYLDDEQEQGEFSDDPTTNAIITSVNELIDEGHTEVETTALINMVIEKLDGAFTVKDLIKANNQSEKIQSLIDSINPSKVKFSTDILTVKNEDPAKEKEKANATIGSMASRALSKRK